MLDFTGANFCVSDRLYVSCALLGQDFSAPGLVGSQLGDLRQLVGTAVYKSLSRLQEGGQLHARPGL